jgi:NADH:ubiquinone oxidoreductase subunit 2 (subunit N)
LVYIFISLLPRALALGSWSLALAVVASLRKNLRLENVAGVAQSMPLVAGAIGLAHLALAGLPFLAAFPARLIIWLPLASQAFWAAILALVGTAGLLVSAVRTITAMTADAELPLWSLRENWQIAVFLSLAMIALVVVGVFPQWFFPALAENLGAFENLLP